MLKLIPPLVSFFSSYAGYELGRPFGRFFAPLLAIIGASLGWYYGRKIKDWATP